MRTIADIIKSDDEWQTSLKERGQVDVSGLLTHDRHEIRMALEAAEKTINDIDAVVERMINDCVWADDGHRIAGIIRRT